jgi:hypothetical protein
MDAIMAGCGRGNMPLTQLGADIVSWAAPRAARERMAARVGSCILSDWECGIEGWETFGLWSGCWLEWEGQMGIYGSLYTWGGQVAQKGPVRQFSCPADRQPVPLRVRQEQAVIPMRQEILVLLGAKKEKLSPRRERGE